MNTRKNIRMADIKTQNSVNAIEGEDFCRNAKAVPAARRQAAEVETNFSRKVSISSLLYELENSPVFEWRSVPRFINLCEGFMLSLTLSPDSHPSPELSIVIRFSGLSSPLAEGSSSLGVS
jgi:hypothetical protein